MFTVKPHYVNLFLAFLTILCFAWLHKTAQRPEMSSASAFWLHSLSSSCWKQQAFKTNILKRKACHDGFWSLMVLRESWWLVFIFLSLFRLTVVNKHGTLQNTLIELLVVKRSAGVTLLSWLTLRHQPDCTVSGLGCRKWGSRTSLLSRHLSLWICRQSALLCIPEIVTVNRSGNCADERSTRSSWNSYWAAGVCHSDAVIKKAKRDFHRMIFILSWIISTFHLLLVIISRQKDLNKKIIHFRHQETFL